jgi:hypothetical protein
MALKNRYPIFIPSKGRYDKNITARSFDAIGADYKVFVEPQEYDLYASKISKDKLMVLPHSNKGLTVTRNYIWDYAESIGYERFWTFDDNIYHLYRFNNNKKLRVLDTTIMAIIENFVERYINIPIAGMNYHGLCSQTSFAPPYNLNTRIYSNMLIKTDLKDLNGNKVRNNLYYNDDTDLCLRVLKDGYCTMLFNAFLIDKEVTMRHKGGMTEDYLSDECKGRLTFAEELQKAHPDVTTITQKFGRWHHHVNYKPFKKNKLILKDGLVIKDQVNNYGMIIKNILDK